jgi:hypothetical protein
VRVSAVGADGTRTGTTLDTLPGVSAGNRGEAGNDVSGEGDVAGAIAVGFGEGVSCGITPRRGSAAVGFPFAAVVLLVADEFINRLRLNPLSLGMSVTNSIVPMVVKAMMMLTTSSRPIRDERGSGGGKFVIGTSPN